MSEAEEFKAAMFDRVLSEGYFVQYVQANQASVLHLNQPYAYTVGRSLFNRPEFLVTGLPEVGAAPLLHALVGMDESQQRHPSGALPGPEHMDGHVWPVEVEDTTTRVHLRRANPACLVGALAIFGWGSVEAIQALWTRDGTYPTANARWDEQPIHPFGETPLVEGDPYA